LPNLSQRLCDSIERLASSKLSGTNQAIRDQIDQTLNGKECSKSISKAVESAVQGVHRSTMESSVIPRFERSTQDMFNQLSTSFNKGTDEYISRLEKSLERRVRAETSSIESTIAKVEDPAGRLTVNLSQSISSNLQKHVNQEISKQQAKFALDNQQQFHQIFAQMRNLMLSDMQRLMREQSSELDIKMEDVISRAQTPAPTQNTDLDLRSQLKVLIRQEKYNEAFTKALMASDLPLVTELMEVTNSSVVFSQSNQDKLEQNIILSLIQQISVDLKTKPQVKYPFLQEAMLALDTNAPSAQHIPSVLGQLNEKIRQFCEQNPQDNFKKHYKLLELSAQHIAQRNAQKSDLEQNSQYNNSNNQHHNPQHGNPNLAFNT
jgi:enhancer of mRNA-decapping protein 4